LGCESDELRHKKVPPRKPRKNAVPRENVVQPSSHSVPPGGYMAVPEIDVRASAGPGALNEEFEETKEMWFFPDPVIRHEFAARLADLRMIAIDGDSMEPLPSTGDRILIDVSQHVPVPPEIFVNWDGMGLVAKRIEHEPNSEPHKVVIKSVNPEYDTYERDAEEVHIIGGVVWTARRL
jgi:phage repressor protein C with HTH and peptisase S24 domain